MIISKQGDLLQDEAETLVNAVNCVGVMGKGIARQFKETFPAMYLSYEQACRNHEVVPGKMHVYRMGSGRPKFIINFPTKRHWEDDSFMEDIDRGLVDLVRVVKELGIQSIAIPPLGCGLGGLDWADVRPRIVQAFEPLPDVAVHLYEPL